MNCDSSNCWKWFSLNSKALIFTRCLINGHKTTGGDRKTIDKDWQWKYANHTIAITLGIEYQLSLITWLSSAQYSFKTQRSNNIETALKVHKDVGAISKRKLHLKNLKLILIPRFVLWFWFFDWARYDYEGKMWHVQSWERL